MQQELRICGTQRMEAPSYDGKGGGGVLLCSLRFTWVPRILCWPSIKSLDDVEYGVRHLHVNKSLGFVGFKEWKLQAKGGFQCVHLQFIWVPRPLCWPSTESLDDVEYEVRHLHVNKSLGFVDPKNGISKL